MTKQELQHYFWIRQCKNLLDKLNFKMSNEIPMSSLEIDVYHMKPEELVKTKNSEIIEMINNATNIDGVA